MLLYSRFPSGCDYFRWVLESSAAKSASDQYFSAVFSCRQYYFLCPLYMKLLKLLNLIFAENLIPKIRRSTRYNVYRFPLLLREPLGEIKIGFHCYNAWSVNYRVRVKRIMPVSMKLVILTE